MLYVVFLLSDAFYLGVDLGKKCIGKGIPVIQK